MSEMLLYARGKLLLVFVQCPKTCLTKLLTTALLETLVLDYKSINKISTFE